MPQYSVRIYARSIKLINLAPFSSFFFEFSVQNPLQPASIDNIFFGLFITLPFFVSAKLLEECEPAVWRHLISCLFLCWATKKKRLCSSQTVHCFYTDVLLNCTCMLDMYGFFCFFLCLKMFPPFCRTPAWHSSFIYGLLTFLGQQQKSDRTFPPNPFSSSTL